VSQTEFGISLKLVDIYFINYTKQRKESKKKEKNWSTEHSKGNKRVPGKVSTTCTEDGHRLPKQALQYDMI
jgi:hypothetical protein